MLLDLFFLLVVTDAEGNVVEVVVDLETLEHATTIALLDHGVLLESLELSVVIEILDMAREETHGDYEIITINGELIVSTQMTDGTGSLTPLDRSVYVESTEHNVNIFAVEPMVTIEVDDEDLTQGAVEVIDI